MGNTNEIKKDWAQSNVGNGGNIKEVDEKEGW
jgi:hypothetical protein